MIPLRMSIMLYLLVLAMCMPDSFSRICSMSRFSTVGHCLSQPDPNRVAKFFTWVGSRRLNHA